MASPERRKLVFLYPEYSPYKTLDLYPRHTTVEEFKNILKRCMGTSSTLFMQIDEERISIPPEMFIEAETLSPEYREKFLTVTAQAMKQAERVTVKIPTFMFSNN